MIPYWKSLGTLEYYTFVKEGKTKKKKKVPFSLLRSQPPNQNSGCPQHDRRRIGGDGSVRWSKIRVQESTRWKDKERETKDWQKRYI